MDRSRLWPDFRAEWIVYEDQDVVAVAKPAGVPSQAADPEHPDDLPERLRRHLGGGYLGIHQRLDRETSGVMVYAKRREANPGLARQLEQRAVEKVYVAAVRGWPRGAERVLRHPVVKGKEGRMQVATARDRRAKAAVTRVREIAREDGRSLLEVRIETGRTHQIRVQLAHEGAPVAGDALYGGPRAERLMLHAARLVLDHPVTGEPLRLEAPTPPEMARWLAAGEIVFPETPAALDATLRRAAEARWGLGRAADAPEPTTAFRLANADADGLPGLALDVYGDFLVANLYDEGVRRGEVLDALGRLGFDGVYLKVRPKQANVLADTRRDELAPAAPVRGEAAPAEMIVREHGVPYVVRLGDGLSTGIFLDQRENRRRVRALSRDAAVLNLFAYTCAFTVAAAAGGARRTVSVDVAAPALAWGERQVRAVDPGGDHRFVRDDVFAVLERMVRQGGRFDLVIVDPPTYSTTKKSRWTSGSDWVELAATCLSLLAPGGRMLACTNDTRMSWGRLRKLLHEAARRAGRALAQMKDLAPPPDFPAAPGDAPHPKSALLTLR